MPFKLIFNQTIGFQCLFKAIHLFLILISHFAEEINDKDPERVGICPDEEDKFWIDRIIILTDLTVYVNLFLESALKHSGAM